jgi:cobalt-zinc-cadmium efflux system outer membrane protein
MTLNQVINTCLIADPKIRAGLEAIRQANADLLTSSLFPNPTLATDVQLLPLTRPFTVDRQGGPPQTDVQLSYPIDWFLFGKRAAAMASAAQGVGVSEAGYADLIRQRVTDAAVAFYDVLEAKALLELAREDVQTLQQVENSTREAVKATGRAPVDLKRVQLDLLRSQQSLREAISALTIAKAKLRSFLGRADFDPDFEVAGNLAALLFAPPLPAEQAYAQAVENRPDIEGLRRTIRKAGADIDVETRKAYPQVTPQLGYTRQFQEKAIGFPDANSWSAAVSITLPVFDRNQGNRAKMESVLAQGTLNLQGALVDLRAEIEQVAQEFRTAYQNAQAVATEQLKLAEEVRDSIKEAYRIGGRPLLEYLDAQRNYRETYRLYISSRANYWRSLYRFNGAVGRQVVK